MIDDKIAKFEKEQEITFHNFCERNKKYMCEMVGEPTGIELYNQIQMPEKDGNVYTIFSPVSFQLDYKRDFEIDTGIECSVNEGWVFIVFPDKSLQKSKRIKFANDIEVFHSKSENIRLNLKNISPYNIIIERGTPIAYGIFIPCGLLS